MPKEQQNPIQTQPGAHSREDVTPGNVLLLATEEVPQPVREQLSALIPSLKIEVLGEDEIEGLSKSLKKQENPIQQRLENHFQIEEDATRDRVLLVAPEGVSVSVRERLAELIPFLDIDVVGDDGIEGLSESFKNRVALVFVAGKPKRAHHLVGSIFRDRKERPVLTQVPIISISDSEQISLEEKLSTGPSGVDGIINFGESENTSEEISTSVGHRKDVFARMEEKSREEATRNTLQYINIEKVVAEIHLKNIRERLDGHDEATPEYRECVDVLRELIEALQTIGKRIKGALKAEANILNIKENYLRRLNHDINSSLAVIISNIGFLLLEHLDPDEEKPDVLNDAEIGKVRDMKTEFLKIKMMMEKLSLAYNKQITWAEAANGKKDSEIPWIQKLEAPVGTRFLIIDDDGKIITAAEKKILIARSAVAGIARNEDELNKLPLWEEADVILLDHDLGNLKGFQLLDKIRRRFPNALIIVHSSDYMDIANMPGYEGLPVVGKQDWKGVSDIIRARLKPSTRITTEVFIGNPQDRTS